MKKLFKKAFTIVELVIVIAVIAVLAAVLIPTFSNVIRKANISSDTQIIRNANTALALDLEDHNTMTDALDAAEEYGLDIAKINAKADGNEILWDSANDVFCYYNADNGEVEYIPETTLSTTADEEDLWEIIDVAVDKPTAAISGKKWSLYARSTTKNEITISTGFDAGDCTFTSIKYENSSKAQDVVIRTNGGDLTINDTLAASSQTHFGIVKTVTVSTGTSCYHEYGAVGNMKVTEGKVVAEEGGIAYVVEAKDSAIVLKENGGKFFVPASVKQSEVLASVAAQINITPKTVGESYTYAESTKTGGNVYEIDSLTSLETFRDLVNCGFNFDGIAVKLTADITLKDGWTPIGEGSRKAAINTKEGTENWVYSGYVYKGEFDGNGHKISNLNNKNYVPSDSCLGNDGTNSIYCYGLFSLVAGDVNIHDLELANVNIDTSRYSSTNDNVKGDSVGAVVGFSAGSLTLDNVKVTGNSTVKGYEGVGGLVGRCYWQDKSESSKVSITNCENNANVETISSGTYAGGIVGYISLSDSVRSHDITIKNNINKGGVYQPNHAANGSNIAGIAMINGDDWSNDGFVHSGNECTGTLKNGTLEVSNLFCKMSNSIYITED